MILGEDIEMETSAYYSFEESKAKAEREVKPLCRSDIFWGVFSGMWAFGITYGIVVAIIYLNAR